MKSIVPVRIQRKRSKGFRLKNASPNGLPVVSVARPGPWGNPFIVGRDGTRARCVELYRYLLAGLICLTQTPSPDEQRTALDYVIKNIGKLRGKNLACWCRLDGKPCHGDPLLEIANAGPPLRLPGLPPKRPDRPV